MLILRIRAGLRVFLLGHPAVSSTRYFVQSVTISTAFQSQPILEVDVYTHEGFILYVNGVEVNRFNLPT